MKFFVTLILLILTLSCQKETFQTLNARRKEVRAFINYLKEGPYTKKIIPETRLDLIVHNFTTIENESLKNRPSELIYKGKNLGTLPFKNLAVLKEFAGYYALYGKKKNLEGKSDWDHDFLFLFDPLSKMMTIRLPLPGYHYFEKGRELFVNYYLGSCLKEDELILGEVLLANKKKASLIYFTVSKAVFKERKDDLAITSESRTTKLLEEDRNMAQCEEAFPRYFHEHDPLMTSPRSFKIGEKRFNFIPARI